MFSWLSGKDKNNSFSIDNQDLSGIILDSVSQMTVILDENKIIVSAYNISSLVKFGLSYRDVVGKCIADYVDDFDSPFHYAAALFNDVFDGVLHTGTPASFEYQMGGEYFQAVVSRITDNRVMNQIRNTTKTVHSIQEVENKNRKELAMAFNAGGLTSWYYDVAAQRLSSPQLNHIIGESISMETLLERVDAQYVATVTDFIDNIVNRSTAHSEMTVKMEGVSGDYLWVNVHAIPMEHSSTGEVLSIVGSQKDVTQEYEYVQKVRQAEQFAVSTNMMFRTIIDNMPASLFVKDATDDFKYIIINKQLCSGMGLCEADIIGKTDYELFADTEEADKYRRDDIDTISSNQTKIIDGEMVTLKNGVAIWYTVKTTLLSQYEDKKYLVGIGLDITDNRRAYNELAKAKRRAEESDILKSTFLANMSHEIRTPLNAIVGFSELLKDADNAQDRQEYWRVINANNEMLLRLISDILDLSKIESGMIELKTERFDLSQVIENIYYTLKLRNNSAKVNFVCDNPYANCFVLLDENRITQIITNFVTNAFKFTPTGEIKMGYSYVDGGIRLYCADTGIGIAKEKLSRVFERFSKLDNFAQGTGLGTAICKAIVDAYSGKIGVESQQGVGSEFWVWIPCQAELSQDVDIEQKQQDSVEDINEAVSMKILIAEDNESNFLLIKYMLRDFDITRAVNGLQAVELARSDYFDCVLMDMKMPMMGGLEATRCIRSFNTEIPIIALTANAFDSDKVEAFEAGCNHFLTKPINKEQLLEVLALR